ncbi:fructose PTS transporter subunit IIA [Bacillus sp. FSL H8-0547]
MTAQLFSIDHMMLDLDLRDRDSILTTLATRGCGLGAADDEKDIFESIMEREMMSTTNVGRGVAIPHCKSEKIQTPTLLFIRLKNPIEWQGEEERVKLVFGILTSADSGNTHLAVLAQLARNLMKDEFINKLTTLSSEEEIYKEIDHIISK